MRGPVFSLLASLLCAGPTTPALASQAAPQILRQRDGRISGRVLELDGTGAVASLVLIRLEAGREVPLLDTTTRTGPEGRYEIPNLPPGTFLVSVMKGAIGPTQPAVQRAWYPGVAERQLAATVTLTDGEHATGIDIWLPSPPRSGVVGRVAWPVGVRVNGIAVDYGDPGGTRSSIWLVSDPDGRFSLWGVPPGPLVLLAHVTTGHGLLMGAASIDVSGDSVREVLIAVHRPGAVEGRVIYEEDVPPSVRVKTLALIQRSMRVTALYPAPVATIRANGRFRATDALGIYEVELRGLPTGYSVTQIRRGATLLPIGRVAVGSGETVRGIEVVVSRSR